MFFGKRGEKKLVMGLMIADDGVDDDSDAVSGGDDYDDAEGGHYSDTSELIHIQLRYT